MRLTTVRPHRGDPAATDPVSVGRCPRNARGAVPAALPVTLLLVLAALLAACGSPPATSRTPSPSPSGPAMLRHTDRAAGFSIDYPEAWNVYKPNDPGVAFLAGPNQRDFVEVRVVPNLPFTFKPTDTQLMKQLIDGLLAKQAISIVSSTQVTFTGLNGWEYVYTFQDATSGAGVHVHVFLFEGNRLYTLVFQALPAADLKPLAPTFDQVLSAFRALPVSASASAAPSSPTAAPSSPTAAPSPTAGPSPTP